MAESWVGRKKGWLDGVKTRRERENKEEPKPVGRPPTEDIEYGVLYFPIRCPKCNSKNVRCHTSKPPIRYHICKDCKYRFKSVETDPPE